MSRRESRLGTYASTLLLLLVFLIGIERYQAKEVAGFVLSSHTRDEASSWTAYLTSAQKIERNRQRLLNAVQERRANRLTLRESAYPPPARDASSGT
ncbi:MAG: hypothetical protein PHO54_03975, partial [Candidatus Peribacteraceae bacterium]|nr:hypothetical protein [Candidatus Peribacteraceae bacterium]